MSDAEIAPGGGKSTDVRPISNPDSDARDALLRGITAELPACSRDELRVVLRVISRFAMGRPSYGALDLSTDPRDFRAEAADEVVDWMFYRFAHEIAEDDARRERRRCEAADELARTKPVLKGLIELRDSTPIVPVEHEHSGEGG